MHQDTLLENTLANYWRFLCFTTSEKLALDCKFFVLGTENCLLHHAVFLRKVSFGLFWRIYGSKYEKYKFGGEFGGLAQFKTEGRIWYKWSPLNWQITNNIIQPLHTIQFLQYTRLYWTSLCQHKTQYHKKNIVKTVFFVWIL